MKSATRVTECGCHVTCPEFAGAKAEEMALAFLGAAVLRLLPGDSLSRSPWPSSLTVHVAKGVRLAVAEAAERDGAAAGIAVAARLTRLIVNELLVYPARMVPFAIRTWRYRAHAATLEPVAPELDGLTQTGVTPKTLECYGDGVGDGPLVLFVHGGSWGQGAPWQYALLSRRLLDAGASRVGIVQYGLFPAADVDDMVRDVEAALEWGRAQQEAARRDGRSLRVVLAAQSAGAHLCSLLQARREAGAWQPDRLVLLSGVFDIAPHFAHEETRLVHWLSPMWLAMRGRREQRAALARPPVELAGSPLAELEGAWAAASPTRLLRLAGPSMQGAEAWPPTVVLHAADDGTVPVSSAREFVEALRGAGGAVAYREWPTGGHGEIMLSLMGRTPLEDLEPAGLAAISSAFVQEATSSSLP